MNHYWYMYLLDIWLTFWVGRRPEWHWPRCPRPGYRGHTPPPPPPTQTSSLLMPRRTMAAFFLAKSPTCIKQTKLYMMIHVSVVTGDNRLANFECQSISHTAVNYLNYVKSILMFTIYTQIREKKLTALLDAEEEEERGLWTILWGRDSFLWGRGSLEDLPRSESEEIGRPRRECMEAGFMEDLALLGELLWLDFTWDDATETAIYGALFVD